MAFSYYIGVKLQNSSITKKEADDRFASTCNLCDCRIPCENCGVNAAHNDAINRITTAEAAKRSAILDKVQEIIDDPLMVDIDESCVAFEAAFGENAEKLLNEVFGEGGLVDIAIGIDEE